MKSDWYFILLFLQVFAMVGLNEVGYGVFALFLLLPAAWLMSKAFEKGNP